jgi:predicted phage tail protein
MPTPPSGPRPPAPKNLKVTKKTQNTITITWTDPNKQTTKWQVSVKIHTGGQWVNLISNSKTFTISNLYPGSNYNIRVAGVSNTGKRGPFTPNDVGITARTMPSNIQGIFNVQAKWNRQDKQLHIKWQNGKVPFTSIQATISCGGTTVSFTIPAGAKNNYPIRNIPQQQSSCSATIVPQYSSGSGNSYSTQFST